MMQWGKLGQQDTMEVGVDEKAHLESPYLHLEYDLRQGRWSLFAAQSTPIVLHATAGVSWQRSVTLASALQYTRHVSSTASVTPGPVGEQLVVTGMDVAQQIHMETRLTLLSDCPGAVCEVSLTNASSQPLEIAYAEPLRALLNERAGCFFGAVRVHSRVHRVLRHGYLYSDPGEVVDIAWQGRRDLTSYWHAAFYIPASRETLVVGYLDNRHAEGQILAAWDMSRVWHHGLPSFDLTARSLYHQAFVLPPGGRISSGRCLLLLAPEPFTGLETYADLCGRLHRVRLNPIIHGWCSWFYTHMHATEEEQLRNATFIAQHLKPYGMEWVQIDDGYQRTFGDWEANDLYPHGMPWLAEEIRTLGLKPGIWIAPYAVAEDSTLVQQHPEWLAHDAAGTLQRTASTRATYILDITHPGAQQWLRELCTTITQIWGYEFIKIDFVEWTLLAIARYYDPTLSRAQVYRLGFEIMRAAVGPRCHLLDCGPGPVSVGLLDSMRIEQDLPQPTWEHYTKYQSSTAPAMAKRYYFHKRTWINDADHICLAMLPISQAQAVASLIALSGGTMISGDRLHALDAARLDILKQVFPTYGEAARPLDLFDTARPTLFVLPVCRDFGTWWLVGYFNWDETAEVTRALDLSVLGLDGDTPYLVYEFWTQRLLTDTHSHMALRFPPGSVHLLAVREKLGRPQVLSTDRHYTQGAVELTQVYWDAARSTLSGVGLGAPGMSWTLALYVPEGFRWDADRHQIMSSPPAVSVVSYTEHILQVQLHFSNTDRVPWAFTFTIAPPLGTT